MERGPEGERAPAGGAQAAAPPPGKLRRVVVAKAEAQLLFDLSVRLQYSDDEGLLFMDEFWRRRDPDPGTPGNPVLDSFRNRVEIADRAYGANGTRGSLTARGRALVLLGAPSLMRHSRRKVPAWRPGRRVTDRGDGRMPVRELVAETWEYGHADLPGAMIALLDERDEPGVTLLFLLEEDGARLVEGEKYLEWAAQSLVQLVP